MRSERQDCGLQRLVDAVSPGDRCQDQEANGATGKAFQVHGFSNAIP